MIEREIRDRLLSLFQQYPFVTLTGPRQSGKTTLCRAAFPSLAYANLEAPDQREFAESDPRGFLAQLGEGAIIDEIQHVPSLLSYLQVLADEQGRNGLFVLTGSEQFRLSEAISQSLAGRTALLRLLPFNLSEREQIRPGATIDEIIYSGCYPRILDQGLEPRQALGDYFETYVERDVRRLGGVRNLTSFRRFVRLCAGRVGQLLNLSSLGSDAGVSHTTAREWLTLLETSYIAFQLPPYFANISKRLVKSPKLYFYDVGLASYLIGIENVRQVATHPLRGNLFENLVVSEAIKHRFNRGEQPNLSFFRDSGGLECDLLHETGMGTAAVEIKSGATVSSDYFASLNRVAELVPDVSTKIVVYGGTGRQSRSDVDVVPIAEFGGVLERFEVEQEVAEFVTSRSGITPATSDVETLDAVYRKHIRPTLDELETACKPLGDALFEQFAASSFVSGRVRGDVLQSNSWERIKDQYIIQPGFQLADDRPLELGGELRFTRFTGQGDRDFNLLLAISWRLDGAVTSRHVTIDDVPISQLEGQTPYSELDRQGPAVDYVVAEVMKTLMARIASLSAE